MAKPRVNATAPHRTKSWRTDYRHFRQVLDLWLVVRCHTKSKSTADIELRSGSYACLKAIDPDSYLMFLLYRNGPTDTSTLSNTTLGYECGPFIPSTHAIHIEAVLQSSLTSLWAALTQGVTGRGALLIPKEKDFRKTAAAYVRIRRQAIRLRTRGYVGRPRKRSAKRTPPFVLIVDNDTESVTMRFIGALKGRQAITIKQSVLGRNNEDMLKAILNVQKPVMITEKTDLEAEERRFRQGAPPTITYEQIAGRLPLPPRDLSSNTVCDRDKGDSSRDAFFDDDEEDHSKRVRGNVDDLEGIEVIQTKTDVIRQRVKRFQEFWERRADIEKVAMLVPTHVTRRGALAAKKTGAPRGWFVNVLVLIAPVLATSDPHAAGRSRNKRR